MEKIKGLKNPQFSLEDLTHVTDLIYFDGPLLSHFKSKTGGDYFYYWCDVDENYNRWLVFEVENLYQYLTGEVSLRELIEDANPIYIVDIDDDLQYHRNIRLAGSLPESYLPDADSYYEDNNIRK